MSAKLFDAHARALRRDRAARKGATLFVYERAFSDILERLPEIRRRFRHALLIGTPDPEWPNRLSQFVDKVTAVDPGVEFARRAGALHCHETELPMEQSSFDMCVAPGTLDTVDALAEALLRIRFLLKPDSLLIGAIPGGDTLPQIRAAMRAADSVTGEASPHAHPRIEPPALAQLLSATGFSMPVVDVDRLRVSYRSLQRLVDDLRTMAVTNILHARSRKPLGRVGLEAARRHFEAAGDGSVTVETFEVLHFAGWTPAVHADHG